MKRLVSLLVLSTALLLAVACGASGTPTPTSTGPGTSPTATPTPPPPSPTPTPHGDPVTGTPTSAPTPGMPRTPVPTATPTPSASPISTPDSAVAEARQAVVDAIVSLTADLPPHDHLRTENPTKNGSEFDVNKYFSALPLLTMEEGLELDYVYEFPGLLGVPIMIPS